MRILFVAQMFLFYIYKSNLDKFICSLDRRINICANNSLVCMRVLFFTFIRVIMNRQMSRLMQYKQVEYTRTYPQPHTCRACDVGCACICVSTSVPPKHINTSTRSATDLSFSIQAADTVSTQFSVTDAFYSCNFPSDFFACQNFVHFLNFL